MLAKKLAAPFGVKVATLAGDGLPIPQHVMNLGETPYEIIERCCRYSALLAYDDVDGNLVMSQVGSFTHASGFVQGVNVQEANVTFGMDERFSVYIAAYTTTDLLGIPGGTNGNRPATVQDPTVPRFRPRAIVSEQVQAGQSLAALRANWEMARRYGRSQSVRLVCDSWRDSGGSLWTPNALARISLPSLKLTPVDPWVISEVSYIRDAERGTIAELTLMPPQAFTPEPGLQFPFEWQVAQDLGIGGHATP